MASRIWPGQRLSVLCDLQCAYVYRGASNILLSTAFSSSQAPDTELAITLILTCLQGQSKFDKCLFSSSFFLELWAHCLVINQVPLVYWLLLFILSTAVLSVITLALIGGKYTGDERWKDLDPELGWCFWLAMCACILVCLLGALGWIYDEMKKSPPAATSTNNGAARRTPARPPPSVAVVDVSPESQTSSSSCSRNVRCIKLVGCIVLVAIYITCFANKAWVVVADQTIQYGLWTWCYTKFTHKDNASAYVNDEGKCHWIAPGDSPGKDSDFNIPAQLQL